MQQQRSVQVNMQPVQQGASPPLPLRWAEALRNVEAAQRSVQDLSRQFESALYLDEEAWRQAVPHAQFTAALQGQQRKIAELEAQVSSLLARLEDGERARRAAEARVAELTTEVENHGSVFKLHYEELLRKDKEIHDLQAVIQALSLGGGNGAESGSAGRAIRGGGGRGGGDILSSGTERNSAARRTGADDGLDDFGGLSGLAGLDLGGASSDGDGGTVADSLGSDYDDL